MHLMLGFILLVCIGIFVLCWRIYNEIKKLAKAIKNSDQKILMNQREIKNELRYHNIIDDKEPIAIAKEYYSETSEVNDAKDFIRGALSKG